MHPKAAFRKRITVFLQSLDRPTIDPLFARMLPKWQRSCMSKKDALFQMADSQQGYLITTPLRTLVDVTEEGTLSYDLLLQAVTDALKRGLVSRKEIETLPIDSKLKLKYSFFALIE